MSDKPTPAPNVHIGTPVRPPNAVVIQYAKTAQIKILQGRYCRNLARPGRPAIVVVGGIQWESQIPRTELECTQTNAVVDYMALSFK